jgi:hypothetical protein
MPTLFASCVTDANQAMLDAEARWPNLSVLDLRGAEDASVAENIQPDGTHLTDAGNEVYAKLLHAALDQVTGCCSSTTTTSSTRTTSTSTTTTPDDTTTTTDSTTTTIPSP